MRPRRRPVVGFAAVVAVCVVALAGDTVFAGQGCVTGFDPPEVVIPALGPVVMSATFAVLTASNDCQWTYERTQLPDGTLVSGFLWLGSPSRTSGTGPASVTFVVAPNESPQPRSLTLFFDGRAVPITQEGNRCYLTLSTPAPSSFPATGGTGSFTVDTGGSPCSYQAAVGSGVTILSGSSGSSFPATVTFSVPPNHTREPAYHFMTVLPNPGPSAPYMLLVTQDANPCPLAFSGVTPVTIPANGGTGSFTVNSSGSSCSYAAQGGDGVTIVSGGSGNTFPATVRFAVGPNTSENPSNRYVSVSSLGTFAFAPTVTIVQNGSPVATDAPPGDFIFATHRSPTSAEYMSPPEPLRITNTEDPTASWIATASEPWLVVSPSSGASPGTATIALNPSAVAVLARGTYTATISIVSTAAPSTPRIVDVSLRVTDATSTTSAAYGRVDIPRSGSIRLSGAVAVSGWALDDVGITRVQIYGSAVAAEAGGEIFLGNGTRVQGARPDVAASPIYGGAPESRRAGWGLMVLSNVLPNGGNGSFTFSAYADDAEGGRTLIGRTTVTFDNTSSIKPFGTIDRPEQGATVSGIYNNQGWILAQPGRVIPFDGSTIRLIIDGVEQPQVAAYGYARPDVLALFPSPTYANANGPALQFVIDTTTFADGLHTIVWVVTDDLGTIEGIGSRYITVQNGAASQVLAAGVPEARSAAEVQAMPQASVLVWERRGLDDGPWALRFRAPEIRATRGERIEVALDTWWWAKACGPWAAYLITGDVAGPLPVGASLDGEAGVFRWQPPVEFSGRYEFVFVRQSCAGREERIPLRITLEAR